MQIRKLVLQQNHLQYTDGFAHPSGVMVSPRTRQVEDESILPCNLVTQDQFSKLQENSSLTVTASSFQFLAAALCSLAEFVDRVMSPISPPLLLITAARSPVSVALGMLIVEAVSSRAHLLQDIFRDSGVDCRTLWSKCSSMALVPRAVT